MKHHCDGFDGSELLLLLLLTSVMLRTDQWCSVIQPSWNHCWIFDSVEIRIECSCRLFDNQIWSLYVLNSIRSHLAGRSPTMGELMKIGRISEMDLVDNMSCGLKSDPKITIHNAIICAVVLCCYKLIQNQYTLHKHTHAQTNAWLALDARI